MTSVSSRINEIFNDLDKVRPLLQNEWSSNTKDVRLAGCYKALSAICAVLDKNNNNPKIETFVFSRLVEAINILGSHYGLEFEEALRLGGAK